MFHTRQPVYLFQHNVYIYAVHKTIFDMYHESFLNLLIVKFVQFYNQIKDIRVISDKHDSAGNISCEFVKINE